MVAFVVALVVRPIVITALVVPPTLTVTPLAILVFCQLVVLFWLYVNVSIVTVASAVLVMVELFAAEPVAPKTTLLVVSRAPLGVQFVVVDQFPEETFQV